MDDMNDSATWSEIEANNFAPMPNMAPVKRFWDRINGTVTTAGNAGAYVYTPTDTAFPTAYVQGETYTFKANFTNVGGDTLNVNSLGAKPLYRPSAVGPVSVAAGDIQNGQIVSAIYDNALNAGAGGFQIAAGAASNTASSIGSTVNLAGSSAGGVTTASWTADELVAETALGGAAYKGVNLSLNFDGATTGAGGMDTGSLPSAADLSVYVIYNPSMNSWSTLGCLGTTSNGPVYTGSNLPSGFVASALIWAGVTTSGKLPAFFMQDRRIYGPTRIALSGGTATSYSSVGLSALVPAAAKTISGYGIPAGAAQSTAFIAGDSSGTAQQLLGTAGASQQISSNFVDIPLITTQTFYYVVNFGNVSAVITNYTI